MRLAQIHVVNFRCLREFRMSFDEVTVLVGANSTGKSTVLHALEWFFDGGALAIEDVSGHQPDAHVSVGVTFTDFDLADREVLGSYVVGDEATFWRTWSPDGTEKLTGKGRAYGPFAAVREHGAAMPKRKAYQELREAQSELGLPAAGSAGAVDAALAEWEANHPEALTEARTDATHLFGFTGQARLARRMDFVLVPAVSDPDAETQDARGTLLRQLLDRALGEQSEMRTRLSELEGRISRELYELMTEEGSAALGRLSMAVTTQLSQLVPGSQVALSTRAPSVRVPDLNVELRVADEGLDTSVGRQGHGFQRALLIAVVQQLAEQTARSDADASEGDETRDDAPSPPALFLALEEPELYQHPLQARHFAATLAGLTGQAGAPVQVAYATHSEHFVDPANYERLRRFRRRAGAAWPESEVTQALVARVAARLANVHPPEQIALRVQLTLRRQVAEAVFAKAVLVVEGESVRRRPASRRRRPRWGTRRPWHIGGQGPGQESAADPVGDPRGAGRADLRRVRRGRRAGRADAARRSHA
jgi:putative ATP-dependent endonuclease of the OLD family